MKFLLLTTCVCNDTNLADLERLLRCFDSAGDEVSFDHVILLQNAKSYNRDLAELVMNPRYKLHLVKIENIISLAKARNKMISFSGDNDFITNSDFISFPDDDCWFPALYWVSFLKLHRKISFDLFYSRFSSKPTVFGEEHNGHNTSKLIRDSSSITTFYGSDIFTDIGFFDERFGVGSKNNGGEDTDFAIRGGLIAEKPYFSNKALVGHKDPLEVNKPLYFRGSLGVLSKYKFRSIPLFYNYLRKLLIGFFYLFTGRLTLIEFRTIK